MLLTAPPNRAERAATIVRVATDLARHAAPVLQPLDLWKSRLAAPELVPLSHEQARAGVEELSQLLPWLDDGNCYARGAIGAGRMEELFTGAATPGAPTSGGAPELHAGVAVVPTSMRATGWTYHAATVFREVGAKELQVVDRLLAPEGGVLALGDWAAKVGRTVRDVRIQQPVDNTPTGGGPITAPAQPWRLKDLGRQLVQALPADPSSSEGQAVA
ncbi:MAG: hypothetical protein JWN72_2650 [Thermoleophilia bacterium]|nr:hypothetical protein [Thermoleophilia bacterium]